MRTSYRSKLTQGATDAICSAVPNSLEQKRAWALFRALHNRDAVDLGESALFWDLARKVMSKRHWLRTALWYTVVP